ncbi:hypothetical protein MRX96_023936 [Rhipicephalus microplus]
MILTCADIETPNAVSARGKVTCPSVCYYLRLRVVQVGLKLTSVGPGYTLLEMWIDGILPMLVPPVTFSPPPLRTRSAQEPPCISGWGGLWKRTVPCGSLDWLLECDGPLDWDRRRSLDRDLARPLDEVPFRWPWKRLLDRDLDLDRLLACCDESRLSTPVAAERLFELELRCAGWLTPSSALAGTVC